MKKAIPIVLSLAILASVTCAGKKEKVVTNPGSLTQAVFASSLKQAQEQNKFVVVDFYTDWCKWCKVLEEKTYPHPEVKKIMDRSFLFEKYNPEKASSVLYNNRKYSGADVAKAFNLRGYPTIMFLDSQGEIIGTIPGFVPPEIFVKILTFVESGGYKSQKFDEYLNSLE